MPRRSTGASCWTRALIACAVLLLPADAQGAAPPGGAPGREARAGRGQPRDVYGRALELARQGQWDRAAPLFELVASLGFKNALWNLAECYRQLGRPATAIAALEGFLRHPKLTQRERQQAETDLAALRGRTARLNVQASPTGAQVSVDGRELGRAPLTGLDLNPGPHVVEVASPGFQPQRREVVLEPGTPVSLELSLPPLPARLRVVTRPAGARLRAGGQDLGQAPVDREVAAGQVQLEARLAGYRTARRTLVAEPGREKDLVIELQPASALLSVSADPPGAAVLLDGSAVGPAPLAGHRLTPGPRRLLVQRPGFQGWSTPLTIDDGQTASVRVSLARGRLPRWIFATTASSSLALVVGGAVAASQARAAAGFFADELSRLRRNTVALNEVARQKGLTLQAARQVEVRDATAVGLFVAAGVTAGAAAVLGYFTRWRPSRGQVTISGTPDGAVLSAGGSF